MTRALVITNPFAARAHARAVTAIRGILRQGGWSVDVEATAGHGDARRIAEQARGAGFDVLVSHGGGRTAKPVAAGGSGGRSAPRLPARGGRHRSWWGRSASVAPT